MRRPNTLNDTPENEVLNFRQNEEENLKDTWYTICNAQSRSARRNFLGSHTVDSYRAIINLVGSPLLMVDGTILTLEHVMQRLDTIENKIALVELIEGLDRKIHNQITQKELIVNDSSRIGKLEDVITNLGSAFATVQSTPNLTLKKTVKPVFVHRASGESSN
ncbi:Far1 [Hordeum vulgare]|nr:Far1 [Hordeum vulgare]